MMKPGDRADMYHHGTKSWYRVVVEEGPLTFEQVMGPDYSEPEGEVLKRRLQEVTQNMLGRME
jgi:hypothetical protein